MRPRLQDPEDIDDLDDLLSEIAEVSDPLGGVGSVDALPHTCLIKALRAHEVPIVDNIPGPLRALADGNRLLQPFHKRLRSQARGDVADGQFVVWRPCTRDSVSGGIGHFVALTVTGSVATVVDDGLVSSMPLLDFCRCERALFFRLETCLSPAVQLQVRANRAAALARRRLTLVTRGQASLRSQAPATLTAEQQARWVANRDLALRRRASQLIRPRPPLDWTHPTVPTRPHDFYTWDCQTPEVHWLSRLNEHPRDHRLVFFPETHRYLLDGIPTLGSVTGVVHAFSEHFDAQKVIVSMVNGSNWPRPGYLVQDMSSELEQQLQSFPGTSALLDLWLASPRDEQAICQQAKLIKRTSVEAKSAIDALGLSPSEIVRKWDINRDTAAHEGTFMHWMFEAWINRVPVPEDTEEMKLFLPVMRSLAGLEAHRTEWMVFGEPERLAGSIDFVAKKDDGSLVLFDWKRSRSLSTKYRNPFRRMHGPMSHLEDCTGIHYRLQLNCYKYLLETYYGERVTSMFVVCTHPDNGDSAFVDHVPEMLEETASLMQYQRCRVKEQAWLEAQDLAMDPFGGVGSQAERNLEEMIEEEEEFFAAGEHQEPAPAKDPNSHELPDDLFLEDLDALLAPAPDEPARPAGSGESATPVHREQPRLQERADDGLPAGAQPPAGDDCDSPPASVALLDADQHPGEPVAVEAEPPVIPQKLKRRRYLPGADSTMDAFDTLFSEQKQAASASLQGTVSTKPDNSMTIQETRVRLVKQAQIFHSQWSTDMLRLVVAALAVYRLRLLDMWHREHALLVWIIEGDTYLRSHNRTVWTYTSTGAFQALRDSPPESTFGRMKSFLLQLEGCFRLMPKTVDRKDNDMMGAIRDLRNKSPSDQAFLERCMDAAIFCLGEGKGKGGGKGDADRPPPGEEDIMDEGAQEQGLEQEKIGWNIWTAKALSKVGAAVQRELLDDRLMTYVSRWCNTPSPQKPGCAYADTCVLYDTSAHEHVKHVSPSPDNHIYISVPHPLCDPVLADAEQELNTFYKQTFWCNQQVFKCCQAAQALAKRGLNIDRLFIGISPGGVGQSLYSIHLHAMYGDGAAFFDPNVWYNDEELRKQVESWTGCFILTGQEAPESSRRLREDLFKKTMSADAIAGRKPYGYSTKMVDLVGWKRLECNALFRFSGVTEMNFASILRRSFCWRPKARFFDEDFLRDNYPDAHLDGIFPTRPSLRVFLKSGPAIAAGLRSQHGFERMYGRERCISMIDEWAVLGQDEGLTESTMRHACGLPSRLPARPDEPVRSIGVLAGPESQEPENNEAAAGPDRWRELLSCVIGACLARRSNHITFTMFKYISLPSTLLLKDSKEDLWAHLLQKRLLAPDGNTHKKTEGFRPVILTGKQLSDVCDIRPDLLNLVFNECLNVHALEKYVSDNPSRLLNLTILLEFLDASVAAVRASRRGRLDPLSKAKVDRFSKIARQLRSGEELAGKLLAALSDPAGPAQGHGVVSAVGSEPEAPILPPAKSRRTQSGSAASSSSAAVPAPATSSRAIPGPAEDITAMEDTGTALSQQSQARKRVVGKQSEPMSPRVVTASQHKPLVGPGHVSIRVSYRYPHGDSMRTRRVAVDVGAQKCSRQLLHIIGNHTVDLDIENCCFSLSLQLYDKLELKTSMPVSALDALKRCANHRTEVCEEVLHMSVAEGKPILNAVFNGGAIPLVPHGTDFLQALSNAGRFMRWLSCELAPQVFQDCKDDPQRNFPEASTFTFVWNAVEDYCLGPWIKHLQQYSLTHLSLHYDGIRVQGDLPEDIDNVCKECAECIHSETGFRVSIRPKVHRYFVECLVHITTHMDPMAEIDDIYKRNGNCIPYALRCLLGSRPEVDSMLLEVGAENDRAASRGDRSYEAVARMFGVTLQPEYGFVCEKPGLYIVHSELGGRPHATAVQVTSDNQDAYVWNQDLKLTVPITRVHRAVQEAIDQKAIVSFRVVDDTSPDAGGVRPQEATLLQLRAGAGQDDDLPAFHVINQNCEEAQHAVDADSEGEGPAQMQHESVVYAGDELLKLLEREVAETIKKIPMADATSWRSCPLCPFRSFSRLSRWQDHLRTCHDVSHQYCASGTKQLKVILCMFDNDRLSGFTGKNYLHRSAEILKRSVRPISNYITCIDRYLRFTQGQTRTRFSKQ